MIRLFRVILPVSDIEQARRFYGALIESDGVQVSPGRHYFGCGGVIIACFDPRADGDPWDAKPNPDHVYFAVPDLEGTLQRARGAGAVIAKDIETQPWGERSFYCTDPFGNKLCFVDDKTLFTAGLLP
jgi:predicted enzyme related to lactoylglutathione lyase